MKDQIQFETNGLTVLAVPIPTFGYSTFDIWNNELICDQDDPFQLNIELPEANWKLHAVTDSMTEEQAKVLVFKMPWGVECYKNYLVHKEGFTQFVGLSPMESAHSLLRSHGIDPAEKWVLLVCE